MLAISPVDASPLGVAPNRVNLGYPAEVIPGVGLSRTLPPILSPNFLSRKHILESIAIDRAGLTLISAPSGFGKSSIVAEFLTNSVHPVIWYTASERDGTAELNAHLIQAIRNVVEGFAPWFSGAEDLKSPELLARIFNELGLIRKHFVVVFDNSRTTRNQDENISKKILDLLPANVHAIAIRRSTPAANYSNLSNYPNFRIIGINDLKLTPEEVEKLTAMYGISKEDFNAQKVIESAQGWPAAVNLIASNVSRGVNIQSSEELGNYSAEPLNLIVAELLRSLSAEDRKILETLAIFEEFSVEAAEIALQDNFSLAKLNAFATEALFLIYTADPVYKFGLNPIIRTSLLLQNKSIDSATKELHLRLSKHFQDKREHIKSLYHAKESGDSKQYRSLFRESMRELIATGHGKDLLQMSSIVGDSSAIGILKRHTVELMGYVADFQYENAQSLIDEMRFAARGSEIEEFIFKFVAAVNIYIDFALGLTEDLESDYTRVRSEEDSQLDLGVADKISILRIMAAKASIYDNSNELLALQKEAKEIAGADGSNLILYLLNAIDASTLLSLGEFKDAQLIANIVIAQASRHGYSGIFGPLDAMYVRARCLLEFSQVEEALKLFEQIRNLGNAWSQPVWVYIAESFLARDLALNGKSAAALELVRNGRDRASSMTLRNGLVTYCDLTELFIKYTMKDWDRVGVLLGRLPSFLLVERIKPIHAQMVGKKSPAFVVAKLPNVTAKDQIYRLLSETEENIDKEKLAIESMNKALNIGARVGAKETFLRQDADLLNLIIRIASEKPTVYLEELASLITSRLKHRSENNMGLSAALTKRELEILRHLATGIPISAIATTLHVSQNTMKTHLKNVYRKMGASGRDEAVAKAKSLYIL
ncbi:MalT ATP-dependent transcriptional regulator [Candidatus Nanopelagicaceae bacterium]